MDDYDASILDLPDARDVPDVRDGLTRLDRTVLYVLHQTQQELGGRPVPTVMLYGRVVEYINISEQELQAALQRLGVESGTLV